MMMMRSYRVLFLLLLIHRVYPTTIIYNIPLCNAAAVLNRWPTPSPTGVAKVHRNRSLSPLLLVYGSIPQLSVVVDLHQHHCTKCYYRAYLAIITPKRNITTNIIMPTAHVHLSCVLIMGSRRAYNL